MGETDKVLPLGPGRLAHREPAGSVLARRASLDKVPRLKSRA